MSGVWVTWGRDWRQVVRTASGTVPMTAVLAASGWLFVWMLRRGEGGVYPVQTLWGLAVAPWLPVLAALLAMRSFPEERASGMLELLRSSPVSERDLVLGKFLAAWSAAVAVILLAALNPALLLPRLAAGAALHISWTALAATGVALAMQAALWCAVGTCVSLLFRRPAAAGAATLAACCGVPFGGYAVLAMWFPAARSTLAWMPLQAHVYDFSTGLFSLSAIVLYCSTTALMLHFAVLLLQRLRLAGKS